jgi:quinol-cytochrome oxidoreductase complex cytochrome b subunit
MLNRLTIVIFLFIILYSIIVFLKPEMIFNNKSDCLRQFGVGYKNTTIVPLWLVSILFAIVSYFLVLYVLHIRYNSIFLTI